MSVQKISKSKHAKQIRRSVSNALGLYSVAGYTGKAAAEEKRCGAAALCPA